MPEITQQDVMEYKITLPITKETLLFLLGVVSEKYTYFQISPFANEIISKITDYVNPKSFVNVEVTLENLINFFILLGQGEEVLFADVNKTLKYAVISYITSANVSDPLVNEVIITLTGFMSSIQNKINNFYEDKVNLGKAIIGL